ncbi:uncharacterized protein LOC107272393 [Cephus cinctus]|uniref:Uncharacterized protein LOC107272393 n=1 Tax=Cephus cinctus TaxID=211228 RepID=A0AAJ7W6A1_CEPCN|nr:uncharacterized protein LOC107272393 [Cephus cinctus]
MAKTENRSLSWKRPSGPPKIWKRFEINEKTGSEGKDGKVLRFSIEEIPTDRYDEVLDLIVNNFMADEPLCRCLNIKDDPAGVEDFRNFWQLSLKQGISVGLFLDDSDIDKREIVGANVLLVLTHEDEELFDEVKFKSAAAETIINFVMNATAETNVLDHYKVDKYISALGLVLIPRFRGYSLGGHILGVRNDIGQEYKIPVTETAFTGTASQILAQRNGFEVLLVKKYSEAYDSDGQLLFPNVDCECAKMMAKRLY